MVNTLNLKSLLKDVDLDSLKSKGKHTLRYIEDFGTKKVRVGSYTTNPMVLAGAAVVLLGVGYLLLRRNKKNRQHMVHQPLHSKAETWQRQTEPVK